MARAGADARARKRRAAELEELGSWLLRDSRRLLRKHGPRLESGAREELQRCRDALEQAMTPGPQGLDLDATEAAAEALDRGLDRHLRRYRKSATREYIEAVGGAIALALLIRAFVFEAFKIPTGSMIPTLHVNDHLFVNKFLYGLKIPFTDIRFFGWRTPHRGEIIVFSYPYDDDPDSSGKDLIKRVIAVPGDRVRMIDNHLYVNGRAIDVGEAAPAGDCGEAVEQVRACADDGGEVCIYAGFGAEVEVARAATLAAAQAKVAEMEGYHCAKIRECSDGRQWVRQHRVGLPGNGDRPFLGALNDPSWPPARLDAMRFGPHASIYAPPENQAWPDYVVPGDHVLVMGDNRDNSKDGRFFGLVPHKVVKGKAGFIWYAFEREFWKPNFARIGQLVHQDAEDPRCR